MFSGENKYTSSTKKYRFYNRRIRPKKKTNIKKDRSYFHYNQLDRSSSSTLESRHMFG